MKIGIFGRGSIGERHAQNARALGHEVATYDPQDILAPGSGNGYSIRPFVLAGADAVVVASPSKYHAKDLMDVIHAGKHVLVEKPFGYDCPPMLAGFVQGARSKHGKNLIIATGFNLRFHSCVQYVKSLLQQRALGDKLMAASFTVNQKTVKFPYLMDGIIRNWMSHEIDLAHYLLGDGEVVYCNAPLDESGNDTISCNIAMDFQAVEQPVYLQGDYFSDPEQRFFWIEGDKATVYVNLVQRQVMLRETGKDPRLVYTGWDNWDQNYMEEMDRFIKSCQQAQHLSPLATGEDGVRALFTVMAAREQTGLTDQGYGVTP